MLISFTYNYRTQTKFAKVMFLQVSVCPQGGVYGRGHAWQEGGMHGWGACGRQHACQGGMHDRGCVWQGGMHGRRHAWQREGHVWQGGACVAGGHA